MPAHHPTITPPPHAAGGRASLPLASLQWLDWEATCLRPAALLGPGEVLSDALQHAEAGVKAGELNGSKPGVPEVRRAGC